MPAFASAMGGDVSFTRLAITEQQVRDYNLPRMPGEKSIVQTEALPPDALATIVRNAIEERLDLKKMAAVQRRTEKIRATTLQALQDAKLI